MRKEETYPAGSATFSRRRLFAQTKMLHFEILVDDVDAAVAYAKSLGATEPEQPADRDPAQLRVMLDPAGHPFCLCLD